MQRHVKGSLFQEYVRMIRRFKDVDWTRHLDSEELKAIDQLIIPSEWYPLKIYQRLGAAVFYEVAKGSLKAARLWGRATMDGLYGVYKNLLVEQGDPIKSLDKFLLLNKRLFDFKGFEILEHSHNQAHIKISPDFGGLAMQGYSNQMLGSFERLVELSGVKVTKAKFIKKAWEDSECTVIELRWESAFEVETDTAMGM